MHYEGRCRQAPRLPRKTKVHFAKRQACHAKVPRRPGRASGPKRATLSEAPCLPRKTNVDVAKRHACHATCTSLSPRATPATQKCRGIPGDQAEPSAPPYPSVRSATLATQNEGRCRQVPRMPCKSQVYVATAHKSAAASRATKQTQARHTTQPSVRSATPATQKCRGVPGDQADPRAPHDPAQCQKCHACHAKRRSMLPSATPATPIASPCRQAQRLPRKNAAASLVTKRT